MCEWDARKNLARGVLGMSGHSCNRLELTATQEDGANRAKSVEQPVGEQAPELISTAWWPGMGQDDDALDFKARLAEQIAQKQGRPGIEVMVKVRHNELTLDSPVIEWQRKNEPAGLAENPPDSEQFVQRAQTVLERVPRNRHVDATHRNVGQGCVGLDAFVPGPAEKSWIDLDANAPGTRDCHENLSAGASEIQHGISAADERAKPPSLDSCHGGRVSTVLVTVVSAALAEIVWGDPWIRRHPPILARVDWVPMTLDAWFESAFGKPLEMTPRASCGGRGVQSPRLPGPTMLTLLLGVFVVPAMIGVGPGAALVGGLPCQQRSGRP
jgi:hypothetical protein